MACATPHLTFDTSNDLHFWIVGCWLVVDSQALRNKIQTDLAKKRGTPKRAPGSGDGSTPSRAPGGGGANGSTRRGGAGASAHKAGTVSALRPTPALTVPSTLSVSDAAQLCAAKRTDCVLVVNEQEHLCGIFTAKDLAFRVIGEGLDPRATHVSQIMTPDPMVTKDTTSATEALQTMVQRHFRHLVCPSHAVNLDNYQLTTLSARLQRGRRRRRSARHHKGLSRIFGKAGTSLWKFTEALLCSRRCPLRMGAWCIERLLGSKQPDELCRSSPRKDVFPRSR